ncbi:hypothetical protein [Glaciimonas sp. PAMC28666]|uniref:hypothetical protein n=1 Tax=Glaciimonas sp. PAMC28666 TaxID=2807626 RepID=UPI001964ACD6|nr:hypothetical protein [Glaciimonas sp. PAMC28666]QRX82635.1 hypothetical protein JQN73_21680 [Glaciimonas sp. PAMC28666]
MIKLAKILANAEEVLFTPNILTETSNLLAYIGEPSKTLLFEYFAKLIEELKEIVIASRDVAEEKHFCRLGLTDAVLIRSSEAENTVVLTADLDLWAAMKGEGRESWNFNHLREAHWNGLF